MAKKKSKKSLRAAIWKHFAKWVKLRDSKDGWCNCISCGKGIKIGTTDCQAGHYYSKGGYPALYYVEDNVWPQCSNCNINRGGDHTYREGLINKIGLERVEALDNARHGESPIKYQVDFEYWTEYYKEEVKKLL